MASRTAVNSEKGLQSPVLSQANICNGMVYVSGNVGIDVKTMKFIEGTCADRTRQVILNMQTVLEECGSSLQNSVIDTEMIKPPMPARTYVCVTELPFKTDVEIECIVHL